MNQVRSFTALQSAAAVEYRRYVGSAISHLGLIDFIWRFREIEMDFFGFLVWFLFLVSTRVECGSR